MDTFLPYLAGFFDGEGSIGIYSNGAKKGRTLRVQLTQNVSPLATELLQECRSRWGGSLSLMNRSLRKQAWNWQASAANGRRVLLDIRPWLRLKAAEADIALRFWDERGFCRRDASGRFLALDATTVRRMDATEAALRLAKSACTESEV